MVTLVIEKTKKIYFQECKKELQDDKLIILLYFIQRNYYAQYHKLLFDDNFMFVKDELMIQKSFGTNELNFDGYKEYSILNTIRLYAMYESWYLLKIAKQDNGLNNAYLNQSLLDYELFYEDASKVRVFDVLYDCFLDELEDEVFWDDEQ